MCIICYKPRGIKIPKISTLKNCFESNPDGAGYMYRRDNIIHIRKGFMTFDAFYSDMTANVTNKDEAVFHFRIGTHGAVSPKNTHPFPITSVRSELHELIIDCKRALVHNGILSDFVDRNDDISDSAFFAKMLYPCRRESQYKAILEYHNKSSKFVIMTSTVTIVSGQFTKKYGCFFSNYGYQDRVAFSTFGTVVLPSGHSYDTTVGNSKYNIIDDDDCSPDAWNKLYDDSAFQHYSRNKNYGRRGSSCGSTVQQPITVNLKTIGGETISVKSYAGKTTNTEEKHSLPQTININGHAVTFSEGISDEAKLEVVKSMFKKPSEKQGFEDYLQNGEKITVTKYPLVSLEAKDKITTYMVNDNFTKERFFALIDTGYRMLIDHKPIGYKDEIVVVGNAKNIIGEDGKTVIDFAGYTVKFFKGGKDSNVVVSIRTHKKNRDTVTPEQVHSNIVESKDTTEINDCENTMFGVDLLPDFFGDNTGGAC